MTLTVNRLLLTAFDISGDWRESYKFAEPGCGGSKANYYMLSAISFFWIFDKGVEQFCSPFIIGAVIDPEA